MTTETRELLALAEALRPLIERYEAGELAPEEVEVLTAVVESMWPMFVQVCDATWRTVVPILEAHDLWPPQGERL